VWSWVRVPTKVKIFLFQHHPCDYRGMAKWFGAHYNQEVSFSSAVKCVGLKPTHRPVYLPIFRIPVEEYLLSLRKRHSRDQVGIGTLTRFLTSESFICLTLNIKLIMLHFLVFVPSQMTHWRHYSRFLWRGRQQLSIYHLRRIEALHWLTVFTNYNRPQGSSDQGNISLSPRKKKRFSLS